MTIIPTSDAINETTVMRQIRKLADCINSRDGGMIADIDFDKESNTYIMVITFADGTSQRFEWDTSPLDISSMSGSVSNGNLTVTIFMSNGTSHAFTCPLNGMATESYVDAGLALKADKSDTYTKLETNTLLGEKADTSTTYTKTEVNNLITDMTLHNIINNTVTAIHNSETDTNYIDITTPGYYLIIMNAQIVTGSDALMAVGWRKTGEGPNWLSNDYLPIPDTVRASGSVVVNFTTSTRIYGRIYQCNSNSQDLTANYTFSAVRVA